MSAKIIAAIQTTTVALGKAEAKATELTLKLEALKAELAAIDAVKDVAVGDTVVIAVGRADTRRNVEAIVRAAKAELDEKGHRTLKVEYTGDFTPGFTGNIAFTPGAFSNEFSVISTANILSVKAPLEFPYNGGQDESDAELERQIAEANEQPVDLNFHADN